MPGRVFAKAILPIVCAWAKKHERVILHRGTPLTEQELSDARRVGVQHPERVRILKVNSVPPRLPARIRLMAERLAWGPAITAGMALGYGIFLRADQGERRDLLIHELAHTAQYERLGFRRFLEQYLHECLTTGYPSGALEAEAQRIALFVERGGQRSDAALSA